MKAILSLFVFVSVFTAINAEAQVQYSQGGCHAYTDCYSRNAYGQPVYTGRIACQTYGATYAYGAASSGNSCSWYVVPGRSVQCTGFAQVRDYYGNFVWGWQNYSYVCPY